MFFSSLNHPTRLFLVGAGLALAACSSPGGNAGVTPAAMQPSSVSRIQFGMSPKALLYVSDSGTNDVDTFAWPKPKTGSVLSGSFSEPQGMCADESDDVFITNTGDENVVEYNGTKMINTLGDSGEYPVGCSYDTQNGALAVSNIISTGDGAGTVSIYKDAKGMPKNIAVTGMQRAYFPQYDGSGDLFVSGEDSSYDPAFAEMPAGANKFKLICPGGFRGIGGIEFPSALGWDGKYLVIGDQEDGRVYRVEKCKVVGTTVLLGSGDVVAFTIVGNRLVATDAGNAQVEIYRYPQGGSPIQVVGTGGFSEPIGAAVAQDTESK